ncbi:MAG: VOC family protein [Oscillospiraceae bacterium]|jgi:lactoylglutathione lyase|nr:VOC family protein [Oscillospiraceae bacterium]
MFKPAHVNHNVIDLKNSIAFYEEALGYKEQRRINGQGFTIVFLGIKGYEFELELTQIEGRTQAYDLGENEFHLALKAEDFASAYSKHKEMGVICYENEAMGIYFISDPDGYWIEII